MLRMHSQPGVLDRKGETSPPLWSINWAVCMPGQKVGSLHRGSDIHCKLGEDGTTASTQVTGGLLLECRSPLRLPTTQSLILLENQQGKGGLVERKKTPVNLKQPSGKALTWCPPPCPKGCGQVHGRGAMPVARQWEWQGVPSPPLLQQDEVRVLKSQQAVEPRQPAGQAGAVHRRSALRSVSRSAGDPLGRQD